MNLIVNQVMELEVVHITNGNGVIKIFARPAVLEPRLAVLAQSRLLERLEDILLVSAVEYGRHNLPAERLRGIAQMHLEHLPDVHTGRNAEWV